MTLLETRDNIMNDVIRLSMLYLKLDDFDASQAYGKQFSSEIITLLDKIYISVSESLKLKANVKDLWQQDFTSLQETDSCGLSIGCQSFEQEVQKP